MTFLRPKGLHRAADGYTGGIRTSYRLTTGLGYAALLSAIFALYVLAGKLGLSLAVIHVSASPVWPPTGLALASLLIFGYRVWPAIAIGAFVVNITTEGTVLTSAGIAAGNTLEGLAGAYLINRFAHGREALEHVRSILLFVFYGAILSPVLSATIGVMSLALGGFAPWDALGPIWRTWWLGDAVGAVIVGSLLLAWFGQPLPRWNARSAAEAAFAIVGLTAASLLVFGNLLATTGRPVQYLVIPFLVLIALRYRQTENTLALFLVSMISIVSTLWGLGPFAGDFLNTSFLMLQGFLGIIGVTILSLNASVSEGRRTRDELEQAHAMLEDRVQRRTAMLRQANERLRDAAREILDLYDRAPCGYHSLDGDGRITRMNATEMQWLGYAPGELLGKRFVDFLSPESRATFAERMRLFAGHGTLHGVDLRLVRHDGTLLPVLIHASGAKDSMGKYMMTRCSVIARE